MATQSPFSLLGEFLESLPRPNLTAPPWAVREIQRRLVLLLNHILMQEPEAMSRLQRQSGSCMLLRWQNVELSLQATPAGLLDLAPHGARADLVMTFLDDSALAIAGYLMRGQKPSIRIEGDVELAGQVNWLTDNVRWDLEDDLARMVGDTPAHTLVQLGRAAAAALKRFGARAAQAPPRTPQA